MLSRRGAIYADDHPLENLHRSSATLVILQNDELEGSEFKDGRVYYFS